MQARRQSSFICQRKNVLRVEVLWIAALLTTGTVGGLVYNWPQHDVETNMIGTSRETKPEANANKQSRGLSLTSAAPRKPPPLPIETEPLRMGDRLLLGGNFIGAYQQYEKLKNAASGQPDESILLRLGLASELAGFHDQAEEHYRSCVQLGTQSIRKLWALLGIARIWETGGRLDEAISLLSELFLLYESETYPAEVRLPINRRLADCLQRRQLKLENIASHDSPAQAIQYHWCQTRIEPVISAEIEFPQDHEQATSALKVIQRPVSDVSLILVDAKLSQQSIPELLDQLAVAIDLPIKLSPQGRSIVSGRRLRINCSALPVSVLLDQVLGPLDLSWQQHTGAVHVYHNDELTRAQRADSQIDRMQRVLRHLQLSFDDGQHRAAALMHDGNIYLARADYENAANKYRSARELAPTGQLSAMLYFNGACLDLAQDRRDEALEAYYRALDQTLSPQLQSLAYAHIAELELELGRPQKAIPAASRGLRLSQQTRGSRNLMTLAKSYLLESDPYSANKILFDHNNLIADRREQRLASVITTFARFQASKPVSGLQNEGERLVVALAALRPEDPQSFIDHLLIARAFGEVGFRSKAIDHLSLASQQIEGGYWAERIRLELAELLYANGNLEKAAATLSSKTSFADPDIDTKARLLDASIKLRLGETQQCESLCKQLLKSRLDRQQQQRTLEILGSVYQRLDQHYAAALCFAGLLPKTDATARTSSDE